MISAVQASPRTSIVPAIEQLTSLRLVLIGPSIAERCSKELTVIASQFL
jgi:hypothetical protein